MATTVPARQASGDDVLSAFDPPVTAATAVLRPAATARATVDLYWLPLGAGGRSVRLNGQVFEAAAARIGRRPACALYHSALVVHLDGARFVVEQAPVLDADGAGRGVVAEGPVGTRRMGRWRLFRYELRRWRYGEIPDIGEAVESPHRLSDDPRCAERLLMLVPQVPTPVWGRDELRAGEMWNSNSVTAWLLASSGIDVDAIRPPDAGRAPGWRAGLVVARRGPLTVHERRRHSQRRVGRHSGRRWPARAHVRRRFAPPLARRSALGPIGPETPVRSGTLAS